VSKEKLLILKEKVDFDPSSFCLWGYYNLETGETKPSRVTPYWAPGPQFEVTEMARDGKNAVRTVAVKMKYEDFFKKVL
jgi:hypothetical protein